MGCACCTVGELLSFSSSFYLFLLSFNSGVSFIRSLKEVHLLTVCCEKIEKMDA